MKQNSQQPGFTHQKSKKAFSGGFTLIETLIAVLILTISIGGLLSLAAGGFFSVRYSRNQIVANNLLQESLEYIRNSRDTAFIQGTSWEDWQTTVLSVDIDGSATGTGSDGCLGSFGCYVDPYTTKFEIKECPNGRCPEILYYPDNSFYGYGDQYPFPLGTAPFVTSFVRKITIVPSATSSDQLIVTGTMSWLNGSTPKTITQKMLITNWRP